MRAALAVPVRSSKRLKHDVKDTGARFVDEGRGTDIPNTAGDVDNCWYHGGDSEKNTKKHAKVGCGIE